MTQTPRESRPRILVVDDNSAIHEDFQKILGIRTEAQTRLEDVEAALFGEGAGPQAPSRTLAATERCFGKTFSR